jgi:hypothetical protein
MSEQTQTPELDFLGDPIADSPAVETAAAAPEVEQDVDEKAAEPEVNSEERELQEAAADVAHFERELAAAKAHYTMVSARLARRQQEAAPLHVQNNSVREAQIREAEERAQAISNLARLGFDPAAVNILAGGVRPAVQRKPHPPLFSAPKPE